MAEEDNKKIEKTTTAKKNNISKTAKTSKKVVTKKTLSKGKNEVKEITEPKKTSSTEKKSNVDKKEKLEVKAKATRKKVAESKNKSEAKVTKSATKKAVEKNSSSKKINKSAKKDDNRVKNILVEQLNYIEKIEVARTNSKNATKEKNNSLKKKEEDETSEIKIDDTVEAKEKYRKNKKEYNPNEIAKKIESKKKLPETEKNKIYKRICANLGLAAIITIYFIFLNLGCLHINGNVFITDLKVFSLSLIAITILFFEHAYHKDDDRTAVIGIEFLILAIITLVSVYIYIIKPERYMIIMNFISMIANMYYVIKSIIIYQGGKRAYKNSISDIKEIVD